MLTPPVIPRTKIIDLHNMRTGYRVGGDVVWHNGDRDSWYMALILAGRRNIVMATELKNEQ